MRLPSQDVRTVDNAGRPSETDFKFKKSIQRFMHELTKVLEVPKIIVGSPTGGDLGDGTINAEELYDDGSRVLTERAGQTIDAGFDNEPYDLGTITSGTLTIDPINGQHQKVTFNGTFDVEPATVTNYSSVSLHVTNGSSAGSPDFSAFNKKYPSETLTTTDTDQFNIVIYFFGSGGADYAIFRRQ
jgi:hypothetical protein